MNRICEKYIYNIVRFFTFSEIKLYKCYNVSKRQLVSCRLDIRKSNISIFKNFFRKVVTFFEKMLLCIWKLANKIKRRFRSKLKNEILNNYLINGILDIDRILDDFYNYVYIIVKNGVSVSITDEDIEEIISDVFVAIWKNSSNLLKTIEIKPYLAGIAKNVIRNKYRNTELNFSISDYEENLIDICNIEKIAEENEQNKVVLDTLKAVKPKEYEIFILFYYESKSIKEIAKLLNLSTSNVKTILHRIRKIIKRNLEDGGYGYGK